MAQERVFPIFLDGDIQSIASGTVAWNGETSRILTTGACTVTVGSGSVPGQLLSVGLNHSNAVTVNVGVADSVGPFGNDTTLNGIILNNQGETVTLMWTGKEWFIMGSTETVVVE